MRGGSIVATNISKEYGATVVLDRLSLTVPAAARLGVVGPNGSGKSTLLRILAGVDEPSAGRVERFGSAAYLPQEPERRPGETLLGFLARRTGVADAEARMNAGGEGYHDALERFLALGGADLERNARQVCTELDVRVPLDQALPTLSGGEAARVSLAALLLARFDVLCLDEPTNDLDFDGLERLERFVRGYNGSILLVSHDRAFLDRTVTRVVAFDAETRKVSEFAGNYASFERVRALAQERQQRAYTDFVEERERFGALLGTRREQARHGVGLGRREIVGPNGAGKTTLLRALAGALPLLRGTRTVGTGVVFGELDQRRELFAGNEPLLERFGTESGLLAGDARTLLAKFGLRGDDALRPAGSLSPGERSRAVLAVLQARGVNCLILDEPTNHLDLEAIEQLGDALADYEGTVLLVTHDRRFLERFAASRTIEL